jgi:hypothetical protein
LLTIRGTAIADFDHTGAATVTGACSTSSRAEGVLTVHFGTRRPVLVRFVAGRMQTVLARRLDGTAHLNGTNTISEECGPLPTVSPEPCPETTRTFRNAATALRSPAAGSITIAPIRLVLRRSECPREPDQLHRTTLGPVPGPLHVKVATLANQRTTGITLTGSARRTTKFGSPEAGILQQRTTWKFTFARTGR